MSKKIFLLCFLFLFSFDVNATDLKVVRMTPSGAGIKTADKIVFEFNQDMVALGDMERNEKDIPIKIFPKIKCDWRWLNQTTLACLFSDDKTLKPSTRYDIKVLAQDNSLLARFIKSMAIKPFVSLTGGRLSKNVSFNIETERAEVNPSFSKFVDFISPERPQYQVYFEQEPTKASVEKSLFFTVDDKEIKVNVKSIECLAWDTKCANKYLVFPVQDLGENQAYQLEYKSGIKALNGGDLVSKNKGVLAKAKTLPPLGIKYFSCYDDNYNRIKIPLENMELPPTCRDGTGVELVFTNKIDLSKISDFIKISPKADIYNANRFSDSIYLYPSKADTLYNIQVLKGISDDWGIKSLTDETFHFKTGQKEPTLNTPYSSVVLEANEQTKAIGYATNIDKLEVEYKGITANGKINGVYNVSDISPKIRTISYPFEYGVRSLFNNQSGYIYATFKAKPEKVYQRDFSASVSPFQVVVKLGKFSSMAWVMDLKTGKHIENAKVSLYKSVRNNPDFTTPILSVQTDNSGIAKFQGYKNFDSKKELINQWNDKKAGLFITVTKGSDLSVLPIHSSYNVYAGMLSDWKVSEAYSSSKATYLRLFGLTTQGIYKAGDKVDFKLYVRNVDDEALKPAPKTGYQIIIDDPMGAEVYSKKSVSLSDFGTFVSSLTLSKQAVSGWYNAFVVFDKERINAFRFLVSDFTPASFKANTEINADTYETGDTLKMRSEATLLSKGVFANAKIRQSATLSYTPFSYKFADTENDFTVSPKGVEDLYKPTVLFDNMEQLDSKGQFTKQFIVPKQEKPFGNIRFETKVFDDSGRSVSAYKTAKFFNSKQLLGLRKKGGYWSKVNEPVEIEYIAVSPKKEILPNLPVELDLTRQETFLVREKTAGNAYKMKYANKTKSVAKCSGVTGVKPVTCSVTPERSGYYTLIASMGDWVSELSFFVQGSDFTPYKGDENKLDISLEKPEYQINEDINVLVKNPLSTSAKALVTVERYGVLESFVQTVLVGDNIISIPAKNEYFPGVYVSVSLFSPRVTASVESDVDLGKPLQKSGFLKVPVLDKTKIIDVKVSMDKDVYRPSDTAKLQIQATTKTKKNEKIEATVIVLDKAILSLLSKEDRDFDIYKNLNKLGDLDVKMYSLIENLIGKQKVEKKGANQGGDGGSDFAVRDVFDFVGYYNPSVLLDAQGKTNIEFKMPDNLTGWKVFVLTANNSDLSGTGTTEFSVSQPLEIRSLLPNQVRSSDKFNPSVSVLNRETESVDVVVSMVAKSSAIFDNQNQQMQEQKVTIKPFERKVIIFNEMTAFLPKGDKSGEIEFLFKARSENETDAVVQKLPVLTLTLMEKSALYGSMVEVEKTIPVDVPNSIKTYGGDFSVSVAPTVLSNLKGVVLEMKDYPYGCWEQKLSRAIVASIYVKEKSAISDKDLWQNADDFIKSVLAEAINYQSSDGGFAFYSTQNKRLWVSPYLSAYTAYGLNYLKKQGYEIPANVDEKLAKYLEYRFKRSQGSSNQEFLTIRLLSAGYLKEKGLVSNSAISGFRYEIPKMSDFDMALFLSLEPENQSVMQEMLNNSYEISGALSFKEQTDTPYSLLGSKAKTNCMALSAFVKNRNKKAENIVKGLPALQTKKGDFRNTQANAFCAMAIKDFADVFETNNVDYQANATFDNKTILEASYQSKTQPVQTKVIRLNPDKAGLKTSAILTKKGNGRLYYSTMLSYPSNVEKNVNAGIELKRIMEIEKDGMFTKLDDKTVLKKGDLVRISMEIKTLADLPYVVVSDSVAGAFEPVNVLLETSSKQDESKSDKDDDFYYKEVKNDVVRFYSQYLKSGTHYLSYMAQVVAVGDFQAFPAKAEAMYSPEVFGLSKMEMIKVD